MDQGGAGRAARDGAARDQAADAEGLAVERVGLLPDRCARDRVAGALERPNEVVIPSAKS